MPHKHKRKRGDDAVDFDLPPSAHAEASPIALIKPPNAHSRLQTPQRPNRSSAKKSDDTPKTFARLLSYQTGHKPRAGLDDGQIKKSKKRRKDEQTDTVQLLSDTKPATTQQPTQPQIQPGERLAEFALRVDQSFPLTLPKHTTAAPHKSPSGIPGLQERKTKHNRRLLRMQTEWRQTEKKLRERQEDENEDQADQREEEDLLWDPVRAAVRRRKGKRKGGDGVEDEDPWAVLEKKRQDTKQKGVTDVVTAPPQLKVVKSSFRRGDGG